MHGLDRGSAWPGAGVVTWFPILVHGWFGTEAKVSEGWNRKTAEDLVGQLFSRLWATTG